MQAAAVHDDNTKATAAKTNHASTMTVGQSLKTIPQSTNEKASHPEDREPPCTMTTTTTTTTSTPPPPPYPNTTMRMIPTQLINLKEKKSPVKKKTETALGVSYQLQRFDVICMSRDKKDTLGHHHIGNNRFRMLIQMRADHYKDARTKSEKTAVVKGIVDAVQEAGGRFLRRVAIKKQPLPSNA